MALSKPAKERGNVQGALYCFIKSCNQKASHSKLLTGRPYFKGIATLVHGSLYKLFYELFPLVWVKELKYSYVRCR